MGKRDEGTWVFYVMIAGFVLYIAFQDGGILALLQLALAAVALLGIALGVAWVVREVRHGRFAGSRIAKAAVALGEMALGVLVIAGSAALAIGEVGESANKPKAVVIYGPAVIPWNVLGVVLLGALGIGLGCVLVVDGFRHLRSSR